MIMYLLLVVAAMLYAVQFIFNQKYQQFRGDDCDSTLLFQMNVAIVGAGLMFLLNQFQIRVTWFSAIMALLYAADVVLYIYFSMKALAVTNLSVYSIFAMLGGMVLPFVYGTVFCSEGITVPKVAGCVLIAISLALAMEKGKGSGKTGKYYPAVFVFNGMMGVISKIHQSNAAQCTDSRSFVAMAYIWMFVITLIWYYAKNRKIALITPKEFGLSAGYAVCNGLAEMFCLIALTKLPASVQYPMITGGVILFSTVVSAVAEKQRSGRGICSAIIALVASIIIIL